MRLRWVPERDQHAPWQIPIDVPHWRGGRGWDRPSDEFRGRPDISGDGVPVWGWGFLLSKMKSSEAERSFHFLRAIFVSGSSYYVRIRVN